MFFFIFPTTHPLSYISLTVSLSLPTVTIMTNWPSSSLSLSLVHHLMPTALTTINVYGITRSAMNGLKLAEEENVTQQVCLWTSWRASGYSLDLFVFSAFYVINVFLNICLSTDVVSLWTIFSIFIYCSLSTFFLRYYSWSDEVEILTISNTKSWFNVQVKHESRSIVVFDMKKLAASFCVPLSLHWLVVWRNFFMIHCQLVVSLFCASFFWYNHD